MSLLDGGRLPTYTAPKTYGDQLPNKFGKKPRYKDGVEDPWTSSQARAIRLLAAGATFKGVLNRIPKITGRTLKKWMGNPYFMEEVRKLTDHYYLKYRAKVMESVALRAINGSAQHARLFLLVSGDLKNEQQLVSKNLHLVSDDLDNRSPQELDALIRDTITDLNPGDMMELESRRRRK